MREVAISNYRILTPFTSPWPFSVVDNFLSESTYNNLLKIKDQEDSYNIVDYSDGKTVTPNPIKDGFIKKSMPLFKDVSMVNKILPDVARHLEDMLPDRYWVLPDLIRCDPKYFYNIHKDHPTKAFSIVVYLHPESGNGTILRGSKEDVVVKWRPNRAVVFENSTHGFHYYTNTTDKYRYSLNIYITLDGPRAYNVSLIK